MEMDNKKFDAVKMRDYLVGEIKAYCERFNVTKVVIGMSGGKDSNVAAALCARALGPHNVFGIMMPDGEQADLIDAEVACDLLGIKHLTVNIHDTHAALLHEIVQNPHVDTSLSATDEFDVPYDKESDINVAPRIRMTILRYIAQAMGAFVCGTGNMSEIQMGYFTLHGDGSWDFNPLGALTSLEVQWIGDTIQELPANLVWKTPSDGLSGQSDEERMGLSYEDIHKYLREGTSGNPYTDEKIAARQHRTAFKRYMPYIIN